VFAIVFGWLLCSVIRTIRERAIGRKGRNHRRRCPAHSRNSSRVVGRYSALVAIIIFSLGIWCHKFDLVISFTGCTLADQGQSLAGSPRGAGKGAERSVGKRARGKIRNDFLRERPCGIPLLPKARSYKRRYTRRARHPQRGRCVRNAFNDALFRCCHSPPRVFDSSAFSRVSFVVDRPLESRDSYRAISSST